MKRHKLTLIGAAVSVVVYLIIFIFKIELFESFVDFLENFEEFELDEIVIPCVIFIAFAVIDLIKKHKSDTVELERIKIYKAMLSSTHHILNNFLNQMLLFKMTAEDTQGFPPNILALYDQIIKGTTSQIEALGNITSIDETSIVSSVAPKSNTLSSSQQSAATGADK